MRLIILLAVLLPAPVLAVDQSESLLKIAHQRARLLGKLSACDFEDRAALALMPSKKLSDYASLKRASLEESLRSGYLEGRASECNQVGTLVFESLVRTADQELEVHLK